MEWSRRDPRFNEKEARAKWRSFKNTKSNARAILAKVPAHVLSDWGREHYERTHRTRHDYNARQEPPQARGEATQDDKGGQEKKPGKKLVSATPFVWRPTAEIPPRQFIYGRHLVRGRVSGTIAPGGRGKSTLIAAEAVDMVTGGMVFGIAKQPLRVWCYNGEDEAEELQRKISAVMQHYGIDQDHIGGRLFLDSGLDNQIVIARESKDGNTIMEPIVEAMIDEIRFRQIDVVQLDPFVSLHQISENDNSKIDAVVKAFARIAHVTKSAMELVHHSRKTGGPEQHMVTVDDARGASSLIAGARSARVLNGAREENAAMLVQPGQPFEPLAYFSLHDGKPNLTPASSKLDWFRLVNVSLDNGDNVGVVEAVEPVGTFDGVTEQHLTQVQFRLSQIGEGMAENNQAEDWIGILVSEVTGLPCEEKGDRQRLTKMIKTWIETKALEVRMEQNSKSRRPQKRVFVGPNRGAGK